jgi:hypothetical protein
LEKRQKISEKYYWFYNAIAKDNGIPLILAVVTETAHQKANTIFVDQADQI